MIAKTDTENTNDANAARVDATALLAEVIDYCKGRGDYNFSSLRSYERDIATIESWEDLELRIELFLSANAKS